MFVSFWRVSKLHLARVAAFFLVMLLWGVSGRLVQHLHHILLQGLLLKHKPVLGPDEVWNDLIDMVPVHAVLKQFEDVCVVRVLCER